MHIEFANVVASLLALILAAVTVLYDCHVSIQDRLKRVPMPVYKTRQAIILACCCGLAALVAFEFTDSTGNTLADSVLGLKQSNIYLRGLSVGLTVLVLIRSKLSSIKGAEVGGELAYNTGRVWVMQAVNLKWRMRKSEFNERNLDAALGTSSYEERVFEELRDAIKVQPEDFRAFVESQIKNVQAGRPNTAFDPKVPDWKTYYRTVTNLALDYAGVTVFKGWTNFR